MTWSQLWQWILENYQWITFAFIMILLLSLTGTITSLIKLAKKGLEALFTPLGIIVFFVLVYIALMIWDKFKEVLP